MKISVGGCCREKGPDMRPSVISLRIKLGKVSGDNSSDVRLFIMFCVRSPVYPSLKPNLRPLMRYVMSALFG